MSIRDEIISHVERDRLYLHEPRFDPILRTLLYNEEVERILKGEGFDDITQERIGYLIADFDKFSSNEILEHRFLKILHPTRDGVWEIKSREPLPQIRVLGQWAEKDTLILLNVHLRADLGGLRDRAWAEAKRTTGARWRQLFPSYSAMLNSDVREIVTGADHG